MIDKIKIFLYGIIILLHDIYRKNLITLSLVVSLPMYRSFYLPKLNYNLKNKPLPMFLYIKFCFNDESFYM